MLAGVIISITLGNGGIIDRAKTAKQEYLNAQNYEEAKVAKASNDIDDLIQGSRLIDGSISLDYDNMVDLSSTLNATGNTYTIPKNGYIKISVGTTSATNCYYFLSVKYKGNIVDSANIQDRTSSSTYLTEHILVNQGCVVEVGDISELSLCDVVFYPFK